ncbi:MAG: hypothetical protein HY062_08100 [Bacteroidetes bacterium]|nr:hypothetical protein [Bacteroidota bacterium]
MKIVCWIGNEPNQIALANKIHQKFPVDTIFVETRKTKRKLTFVFLLQKTIERLFLSDIAGAWFNMQSYFKKKYPTLPEINIIHTDNINSVEVYEKSKLLSPDLIVVSGTSLIKEKLLSLNPKIGIVNLHTGGRFTGNSFKSDGACT